MELIKSFSGLFNRTIKKDTLEILKNEQIICRIFLKWDRGMFCGVIVDHSTNFILIQIINEYVRLNGYSLIRIKDVKKIQMEDPRTELFLKKALEIQDLDIDCGGSLFNLNNIEKAFKSIIKDYPFVTVFIEKVHPGSCFFGSVIEINDQDCKFKTIGPDAVWNQEPMIFGLDELTRIDWGDHYSNMLWLVNQKYLQESQNNDDQNNDNQAEDEPSKT